MKSIFFIVSLFVCLSTFSQSTYPIRADKVLIEKVGGKSWLDVRGKGSFTDSVTIPTVDTSSSNELAASTSFVHSLLSGFIANNSAFPYVANVDSLRTSFIYLRGATAVQTQGYYTINDRGNASYYWDGASSHADDGFLFIKPTAVSGAGRWRLLIGSYINVLWTGVKTDDATDGRAGFIKAYNYCDTTTLAVSTVVIPPGNYILSDSILNNSTKNISFIGLGSGSYINMTTHIRVASNKKGFVTNRPAVGVVYKNIMLESGGTDTLAHGWTFNTVAFVENICAYHFAGDGVHIDTRVTGNANSGNFTNVFAIENACNGIFVAGEDANNIEFNKFWVNDNGRSNVLDMGFLGNYWVNGHSMFAGMHPTQKSWVTHGGGYYVSMSPNPQSGIEPQVTSGWQNIWEYHAGVDVPSYVFAWDAGTTYYLSSAFAVTSDASHTDVAATYTEGGQGGILLLGYSSWIGGNPGSGFAFSNQTNVAAIGVTNKGEFENLGGWVWHDINSPNNYVKLNRGLGLAIGTENTDYVQMSAYNNTDSMVSVFAQSNAIDYGNLAFPYTVKSAIQAGRTGTYGRVDPIFRNGFYIGDSTTQAWRKVEAAMRLDSIKSGQHVNGDIIFLIGNSDTLAVKRVNGAWVAIKQGGGGAAVWGAITGTLSAQTDLQAALDAKAPLSGTNIFTGVNTFSNSVNAGSTSTGTGTIPLVVNASSSHATYLLALGKNNNSAYFRIDQNGNITDIGGGNAPISSSGGLPYFSAGLKSLNMTSAIDATILFQMNQGPTFPWFIDNRASTTNSMTGFVISGNNAVTKGDIQEWVDKDFNVKARVNATGMPSFTVQNFANNAAAISGGLAIGDVYRNGDALQIVH